MGFAPWPTMYWYFAWWHDDRPVERIHDALCGKVCEAYCRDVERSAGPIDSQSVRSADTVPAACHPGRLRRIDTWRAPAASTFSFSRSSHTTALFDQVGQVR
ncbi:hypothetical protein [Streptomyces amritsarensis]|uniref:hypothetical protein n=1 Tax=Streptomyces amritsarensis TaxID=681158 RepID=UPI003675F43A